MPTATLTSKGQLTLPRKVREHLKVQAGDAVEFVIAPDGGVRVRAGEIDASDLKGLLRQPGRRAVSLAEMERAIRDGGHAKRR